MSERPRVIRVGRTAAGFVAAEPLELVERPVLDRLLPLLQATLSAQPGTVLVKGRSTRSEAIYWDQEAEVGYAVLPRGGEGPVAEPPALDDELAEVERVVWKAVSQSESLTEDSVISVADDFLEPGLQYLDRAGQRSLPWYELRRMNRAVLVGEPGAGKTTSLQRLALDQLDDRSRGRSGIPLFVRLRDLHDEPLEMPSVVQQAGLRPGSALAESLLHRPGGLLLLDGLDEVTEARQAAMAKEIWDLADRLPEMRIIVSCRQSSYVDNPLPGFDTVTIEPFDNNRLAEWSCRYFRRRGAEHIWHEFVDAVLAQDAVRDLCRNPLMLNLTARLYESSAVLPSSRTDLYGRCLQTMTFEWDEARGVRRFPRGKLWHSDVEQTLRQTALRAMEDSSRRVGEDTPAGAKVDVSTVARSSGLLARTDDGYRFVHSSFAEYLTARWLTLGITPVREQLSGRLTDQAWQSVWLILCGMMTDASALCEDVLEHPDLDVEVKLRLLSSALAQGSSLSEEVERRIAEFLSSGLLDQVREVEQRSLSSEEAKARRPEIRPLAEADLEGWREVALSLPTRRGDVVEDVILALHQAVSSGHGTKVTDVLGESEDERGRLLADLLSDGRVLPRTGEAVSPAVKVWVQVKVHKPANVGMTIAFEASSLHRGIASDVHADGEGAEEAVGDQVESGG